ncbi:MAG: hypothetical protein IJV64_03655, partial [Oscillospiraceae bacterium]|nr:hypothetical protein [Oscillospiraceae bacterium]
PGVNVPAELRRIRSWSDANPKKRKTGKGIRRCINGWLDREQNKGGPANRTSQNRPAFGRSNSDSPQKIGGYTF